jgi:hypothetical protein
MPNVIRSPRKSPFIIAWFAWAATVVLAGSLEGRPQAWAFLLMGSEVTVFGAAWLFDVRGVRQGSVEEKLETFVATPLIVSGARF